MNGWEITAAAATIVALFWAAVTVRTAGPATVILHNARVVVLERSAPAMPHTLNFTGGGGSGAGLDKE